MAWARKNETLKIKIIQKIIVEHQKKGVTQQWVYDNIVHPRFFISKSTYNNYLGKNINMNVKRFSEQDAKFKQMIFDIENDIKR